MPTYGVTSLSDRVMVQYDFRGERVFQHRNLAKWSIGKNPRILDFWYETECMKSAREYRTEYLAQRFELSERDRARTKSLVGAKFWYIRCKHDHRVLELSEEFEIGEGCGGLEQIYFVKDDELYILDYKGSITCRLQQAGGLWVGRWETYERMPIVLEPIE
jgi:hypothetical protein